MKLDRFIDAHAMSILHPESFSVPTNAQLQAIGIGDFVKVSTGEERFWLIVEGIDQQERTILGRIDNELLFTHPHGLKLDDLVIVGFQNVYAIDRT